MLYPYDKDIDLNDKNDLKLHEKACSGLKDNDRIDGSLDKASKF